MDKNSINERCCCHPKGATRAMETEQKMKSQQAIPSHMRPNDPPKIKSMKIKKKKGEDTACAEGTPPCRISPLCAGMKQ